MEEKYINRATITPHWINGGDAFWYRRFLSTGKHEFVVVDVLAKERRPAFDHERLAEALGAATNGIVDSHALPFTWIDLSAGASHTRFFCNGKKWTFSSDGLQEWDGNFGRKSQFLAKERPSGYTNDPVTVTFVNHTSTMLSTYWVDWDGKAIFYSKIAPGASKRQRTVSSHVWRLVDADTKEVKAIYMTPNGGEEYAIIEDGTMEEAGIYEFEETGVGEAKEPKPGCPVFVKDSNVWLKSPDGEEFQITRDGSHENPYDRERVYVSPDEKHVVAWQYEHEEKRKLFLRESAPADQLQPKIQETPYLKPGDRVRIDRPQMLSLESRAQIPTDDFLFRNQYNLTHLGWSSDGSEYRSIFNERGHQHLRVIGMKSDGAVRALVEESSETFIDYSQKLYHRVLKDTDELLWASERNGFNHLYLFDLTTGELKSQVTDGRWNVHSVVSVDEGKRQIWFKGYGMAADQDLYHAHLARVNFDGTDYKILTQGDGTHHWVWSPDQRFFVDTWSRVDCPPQSVLRNAETGELVLHLEGTEADLEELEADGWIAPERFTAAGRDGTTPIYGIILTPSNFDASKRYPILEDIYAGPQGFHTPKSFTSLVRLRRWAEQGYVVVVLDGMGTNWRSKAFHDVCHKNLKDAGFPDRIAWITAAAESRPWMDLSRVGLMGVSAGGQSAVAALLHHGEFYKAAVAESGCHDNRMDKLWWNEQWMGYPVDESYEDSSNVVHADKLEGALMLIVGELDNNVDPATTLQLVKALQDLDKDFEFLFIPGGDHHCGRLKFAQRRQERFMRQHLQGTRWQT
ncbi:Dipeptidyl aminopeptidase 4 [Colletotrichum sidae]|uniref:Probable dipeptidyl-aminopeptidase B n=1 Tax=Colletotrichum sidae TaxID=1347389 RepID=A0A4R8T584_9PEZI|nr:Dipeptidyl aminopeptidase 4 [Colletotrichum sidae]